MDLAHVLGGLPANDDPRVLADFRHASDAGVYLLRDGHALVQSVDFFTPIVDDPYTFGAAAAANALSDLYAVGARPLTALAVVCFPKKGVEFSVLEKIALGGHDKIRESGAVLIGGHTVQDPEIKFGYAVTGELQPARRLSNASAQPGDTLYLTKPIGTGVLATALKKNKLPGPLQELLYTNLCQLNREASEAMVEAELEAATDVTGFGLLGHAGELARASGVSVQITAQKVPLLEGALRFQAKGYRTGGVEANRCYIRDLLETSGPIDENLLELLLDPQTSGGLLICASPEKQRRFLDALSRRGAEATPIGEVREGPARIILR